MASANIAVIGGDGIGPEVIEQAIRVTESVLKREEIRLTWQRLPWSSAFYKKTGHIIPDDGWDTLKKHDAILFGSAARGEAGPDSDIDLLVVLDDDAPPEKLTLEAAYEARGSYDDPTDIFPCREQTYRRKCQIVGTLPYAARTEGIVVYERP